MQCKCSGFWFVKLKCISKYMYSVWCLNPRPAGQLMPDFSAGRPTGMISRRADQQMSDFSTGRSAYIWFLGRQTNWCLISRLAGQLVWGQQMSDFSAGRSIDIWFPGRQANRWQISRPTGHLRSEASWCLSQFLIWRSRKLLVKERICSHLGGNSFL